MQNRIAATLLVASATAQAFVCFLVTLLVPAFFRMIYNVKSHDDLLIRMPTITRLVTDHAWFIAVAFAIVCCVALLALRWRSQRLVQILALGLCAQGLVTWLTMFSLCYDGFIGPRSNLTTDPGFELDWFLRFAYGVFPVTFLLIVAPMIAALWSRTIPKSSHEHSE